MRAIVIVSLAVACLAGLPAAAQPAQPHLDALAQRLAREAELADQDARSEALNVEINRRNAAVEARNAAARAAYEQAQAAYEAELASQQAQAAAAAAEHARAVAAWEAQVAACKAGDLSACAPR